MKWWVGLLECKPHAVNRAFTYEASDSQEDRLVSKDGQRRQSRQTQRRAGRSQGRHLQDCAGGGSAHAKASGERRALSTSVSVGTSTSVRRAKDVVTSQSTPKAESEQATT